MGARLFLNGRSLTVREVLVILILPMMLCVYLRNKVYLHSIMLKKDDFDTVDVWLVA